jgi:hypothetical protein
MRIDKIMEQRRGVSHVIQYAPQLERAFRHHDKIRKCRSNKIKLNHDTELIKNAARSTSRFILTSFNSSVSAATTKNFFSILLGRGNTTLKLFSHEIHKTFLQVVYEACVIITFFIKRCL